MLYTMKCFNIYNQIKSNKMEITLKVNNIEVTVANTDTEFNGINQTLDLMIAILRAVGYTEKAISFGLKSIKI